MGLTVNSNMFILCENCDIGHQISLRKAVMIECDDYISNFYESLENKNR